MCIRDSYCGAANLKELHDNAQFIEMSGAGLKESHPHDVQITNEAPNYSMSVSYTHLLGITVC